MKAMWKALCFIIAFMLYLLISPVYAFRKAAKFIQTEEEIYKGEL